MNSFQYWYSEAYSDRVLSPPLAVEIIQPSLPFPWLTTPICVLIALNLFGHYYYVCTVQPGFVNDLTHAHEPGTGVLWARRRVDAGARTRPLTGVRWTEEEGMPVTRAAMSKCKRCGEMRPEVSVLSAPSLCSRLRPRDMGGRSKPGFVMGAEGGL